MAVGPDDVEKGLHPGLDARVGGVAVELQGQGGLAAHDIAEVGDDEGIGPAGEIGDVDPEELGVPLDEAGRLQDQGAHPPVHVPLGLLALHAQKIEGDHGDPPGGKFPGDAQVGLLGKAAVRPRKDDGPNLIRVRRKLGQHPVALLPHPPEAFLLLFQGKSKGLPGRTATDPHPARCLDEGLFGTADPPVQIQKRREEAGAAGGEGVDPPAEGRLEGRKGSPWARGQIWDGEPLPLMLGMALKWGKKR